MKKYTIIGLSIYWLILVGLTISCANAADWLSMSYREEAKNFIKNNEGFSNYVYEDTRNNYTVGYGHKLPKYKHYIGEYIDNEIIDQWFEADFEVAHRCAFRFITHFNPNIMIILTDMAFNLGCANLNEFKLLKKHLNNHDYIMAAKAIRLSNYYKQVTNRAKRNIAIVKQQ